ncbi:receptor protein kinase-like protein ZAR1 [Malania oleifera]|uniref:receptor protein kinase-like protein ZAR1 n=1 Tax=Malania oleifera TaxID=397392 RepID=UPI0025AE8003|nr:receptor protein kinase-like protein ZAR1 [Malania oleifera]
MCPTNQNLVSFKSLSHKCPSTQHHHLHAPPPFLFSATCFIFYCSSLPTHHLPTMRITSPFFFFFSFFFCFALFQNSRFGLCLTADGLALLSLKSAVDQSSGDSLFADWNENDSVPCRWSGVSCANVSGFADPRVVGVAISGKNLRGYIPSELGSLQFLRRLNLHGNDFSGSIPVQLFNATSLHSLFLYGNNLSGELPPTICKLPRLQNLDLSNNSLSGSIPGDLSNCRQLQRLVLAGNNFSGEIPAGVFPEMENLVQLDLSSNHLRGSIPEDIGELKSLAGTLNLSFNHLSGKIPKSLGNLPVTLSFDLRNNNLSGEIPQTGSFANQGPTAFLNNPSLCGFPLQKPCRNPLQSSPARQTSSPESETNPEKGLSPGMIILISVADAAGVSFVGFIIVYLYWKRKDSSGGCSCTGKAKLGDPRTGSLCSFPCFAGGRHSSDSEADSAAGSGAGGGGRGEEGEGELVAIDKGFNFELDELLRASAYVLGKSGLGIVYKVVLGNGVPVAVRRLGEGGDRQRYKEFAAEVQAIGRVKHPNIVKLRAYYWAPDEKLLISDFISHGNLASALRGKNGQPSPNLTWSTRLTVAKGTARGLAYLHECSPRKFVHGDVKPSNILLDADLHPYISDFGLNRLISIAGADTSAVSASYLPYVKPSAQSDRSTNYRAPEARVAGARPAQKWDVYSFGVVLLELLTGKSPDISSPTTSTATAAEVSDLVRWVRKGFEVENPLSELVDPTLLREVQAKKEVLAVFHVALACTEADPEIRPRMKTVADNLDRIGS